MRRFDESYDGILEAVRSGKLGLEGLVEELAHDSYHVGQIMLLRALQGSPGQDFPSGG